MVKGGRGEESFPTIFTEDVLKLGRTGYKDDQARVYYNVPVNGTLADGPYRCTSIYYYH